MTKNEIKIYREKRGVSLIEAKKVLGRLEFCKKLRASKTIEDIADTFILILNYEFSGYTG